MINEIMSIEKQYLIERYSKLLEELVANDGYLLLLLEAKYPETYDKLKVVFE